MKQLLPLILGFVAGQGSMFAVSTWLLATGDLERLGQIGILLGMLGLFQWIADWGGIYILSERQRREELDGYFARFAFVRVFLSLILGGILFCLPMLFSMEGVYKISISYALVVMLAWSFNLTGVIDGAGLNRVLGFYSGLNWIFASLTVCLMPPSSYFYDALAISFLLGTLTTVFIQFRVCKQHGIVFPLISMRLDKKILFLAIKYNVMYSVGQCYGRVILIIVDKLAGAGVTGVFVYAKQIYNAIGQVVIFSRRIDYHKVLSLVSINDGWSIRSILKYQMLGVVISIFSFLVSLILLFLIDKLPVLQGYSDVISGVTMFMFVLVLWTIASGLSQALIAYGRVGRQILIVATSSLVSIFFMMLDSSNLNLIKIAVADDFIEIRLVTPTITNNLTLAQVAVAEGTMCFLQIFATIFALKRI